mmetsp:Transcript_71906/g.164768  ORF Transcript_71906/g.164768 Transcript_71906/m.164768 type:complete len:688 (+) Transcript_71906:3-2066(+)
MAQLAYQDEPALSAALLRSLSDRVYEKRKTAALEIEARMRELVEKQERGGKDIERILELLGKEYAGSNQANYRKGGLIGLAAATLGLNSSAHKYLNLLLPPVLLCFPDQDSRVRYYACEALYNVAKVTRSKILAHLNEIFQGLCRLCADIDQGVKNGAQLLDRLLKDIVANEPTFTVDAFIPVLRNHLNHTSSHVRHFLVGWVSTLHAMPHVDLHPFLPQILEGLFAMLNDSSREIRQRADSCLAQMLRTLQASESIAFAELTPVVVRCATEQSRRSIEIEPKFDEGSNSGAADTGEERDRVALMWLLEFTRLGKEAVLPFTGELVQLLLKVSSASERTREIAEKIDAQLRALIAEKSVNADKVVKELDLLSILSSILGFLNDGNVQTRLQALTWLDLLVDMMFRPGEKASHRDLKLLVPLVSMVRDKDQQVLRQTLAVIAKVSERSDSTALPHIIRELLLVFASDATLMQERSGVMVKELCQRLDPEKVYLELALQLEAASTVQEDHVARCLTEKLTMILLTVPEMSTLRDRLRLEPDGPASGKPSKGDERALFLALHRSWSRFPAAGLCLCLLAGEYQRSCDLVEEIGRRMRDCTGDETMRILIQLDKLVQLIESPVLAPLRMQLLQPTEHPHLIRAMYGILMLLPQSEAFEVLRRRLKAVPTLALLALAQAQPPSGRVKGVLST